MVYWETRAAFGAKLGIISHLEGHLRLLCSKKEMENGICALDVNVGLGGLHRNEMFGVGPGFRDIEATFYPSLFHDG